MDGRRSEGSWATYQMGLAPIHTPLFGCSHVLQEQTGTVAYLAEQERATEFTAAH
jgi:hypothetical protein